LFLAGSHFQEAGVAGFHEGFVDVFFIDDQNGDVAREQRLDQAGLFLYFTCSSKKKAAASR